MLPFTWEKVSLAAVPYAVPHAPYSVLVKKSHHSWLKPLDHNKLCLYILVVDLALTNGHKIII